MAATKAQERARRIGITREYAPDRDAMLDALSLVLRGGAPSIPTDERPRGAGSRADRGPHGETPDAGR